ncbi:HAD family hydrolase [Silvimonas iriomotensis]|uniref:Glycerol-3-phosphatase n=1 Tax=Silvimonas iriomotensis TaxID=449662 RepID=A0ABQ2P708_9NEIS|nr:HAD family hydrolase [Silvimonas iriomotensis]GGP19808.1 glycerol-3-phosphatase [Silvimonas iriomotensis]
MSWQMQCEGFLFDMDGTLVDSTVLIERIWHGWALKNGIDFDFLMQHVHGRRGVETIEIVAPHMDAKAEVVALLAQEMEMMEDIPAIPGAAAFLASLPAGRWAVVTSASRAIAQAKLRAAGLPVPDLLVSSDDVENGKPHPEPYLKGAALLGLPPSRCVVFEDAEAGIRSGHAAGMNVVAILHASGHEPTGLAGAKVAHYDELTLRPGEGAALILEQRS